LREAIGKFKNQNLWDMEVHTHAHTPRKKFTHYLWEFLMLFLAVFCGFLAEYQLEHMIEHQREKQFVKSLLVDLSKDKISLQEGVDKGWIPVAYNDSLSNELRQRPLQGREKRIYHFFLLYTNLIDFTYHDRTIAQLKYSGGFRLIKDQKVSDAILDYDTYMRQSVELAKSAWTSNLINNDIMINSQTYEIYRVQNLQDSALTHIAEPEKVNYPAGLKLLTDDEHSLVRVLNSMAMVKGNDETKYKRSKIALEMNDKLDALIRKEYHLE
jgi:hypothetical protein